MIISLKQIRQRHFPLLLIGEMFRDPPMFRGHGSAADLGPESSPQKISEQRMKAVFLSFAVACHSKEYIFLRKLGQHRRASQIGKKLPARVEIERLQKGEAHQQ